MKHAMPSWILPLALLCVTGCVDAGSQANGSQPSPEWLQGNQLLQLAGAEFDKQNYAGALYLATEAKNAAAAGQVGPGALVEGVVTGAVPARHGNRAMLEIEMRKVSINDRETMLRATTEPVIAGSPRARSLAAVAEAGSADAEAASSNNETGAAHEADGGGGAPAVVYQMVLPEGTVLTFTVSREVAMR